jgi:putative MATE family efflux protein
MNKENKMGVMPIPKLVATMSLPIMISMLVQSMYNIVDSIFVAKINEHALTATSIAYSAQMLQIAVAVGTGVGVNALVSRSLGAKKFDRVDEAATTGLYLTLISSLVFVLWGVFGTEAFISLFTDEEAIIAYGTDYLKICQLFSSGLFIGTLTQRLLQATGRTFSSMMAQMVGALVNLILDPLLIFGLGFFPEMGIKGAAIATVLGQWTSAVIGLILNYVQNKEVHFVFKGYRMNKESVKMIYKVGAPTILMQSFGSIMVGTMNMILVMFSTTAVAFFGVYFKLQSFLFMPMNGLGQGTLPIVGYNFGAGNIDRIKQTAKTAIAFGCTIGLVGTIVFMCFTRQLLGLFSASEAMLAIGIPALRIISAIFMLSSVTMVIGYIIAGLGNGMINMLSAAIRQIIMLLPFVLLIGKLCGISYVWYSFWISEVCAFVFALYNLGKKLRAITDKVNT